MRLFPQYAFKSWTKRFAAAFYDGFGSLFLKTPSREINPALIKKILVVRLDHVGDVVMTRPALALLRKKYPHARIDLLVSAEIAELIRHDPWVHQIVLMQSHWFSRPAKKEEIKKEAARVLENIRDHHYDLGIDFRGDLRVIKLMQAARIPQRIGYGITGGKFRLMQCPRYDFKRHQVEVNAELLRCLGVEEKPANQKFVYTQEEKKRLLERFPLLNIPSYKRIAVHPGAGLATKLWGADKYQELLKKLTEEDPWIQIVLVGTAKEQQSLPVEESPRMVDLRGKTSLSDLPVILDQCSFFIGNDSGPGHIAAAQEIPGVVLFSGTNEPSAWRPWSEAIQIFVPSKKGMESISVKEVLGAVRSGLSKEAVK